MTAQENAFKELVGALSQVSVAEEKKGRGGKKARKPKGKR